MDAFAKDAFADTSTPDEIEQAAGDQPEQSASIRDFTLAGCAHGMGLGLSAQNVVSRVFENSPAARCALRVGDKLLSVDGASLEGCRVEDILAMTGASETHVLRVQRGVPPPPPSRPPPPPLPPPHARRRWMRRRNPVACSLASIRAAARYTTAAMASGSTAAWCTVTGCPASRAMAPRPTAAGRSASEHACARAHVTCDGTGKIHCCLYDVRREVPVPLARCIAP